MRTNLVRSATAALLAAFTLVNTAWAVYEAEPNDSYNTPQRLVIGSDGTAMVTGSIGDPSGAPLVNDVDFYTFEGRAGDVVTIDIDGGIKGSEGGSHVDTLLTLFRPDSTIMRETDDGPTPPDAGSISSWDAQLAGVRLLMDGTYTVAVTASFMSFMDGGIPVDGTTAQSNGSYTLTISGVTPAQTTPPPPPPAPAVQQIDIDIKPRDRGRAHLNPKWRGRIPVALLSSAEFNALEVDHASVTFGPSGKEARALRCGKQDQHRKHGRGDWDEWDDDDRHGRHNHKHAIDVNRDGRPDLVCRFDNQDTGFELGDMEGMVMGKTTSGKAFEGKAPLKVYPYPRHHHKHQQDRHDDNRRDGRHRR
jgi:hypothetical protein